MVHQLCPWHKSKNLPTLERMFIDLNKQRTSRYQLMLLLHKTHKTDVIMQYEKQG